MMHPHHAGSYWFSREPYLSLPVCIVAPWGAEQVCCGCCQFGPPKELQSVLHRVRPGALPAGSTALLLMDCVVLLVPNLIFFLFVHVELGGIGEQLCKLLIMQSPILNHPAMKHIKYQDYSHSPPGS